MPARLTLCEKSSGSRPDVALGSGEDSNLIDVAFSLTFFRHLNNSLELRVHVVVAQANRVDDDVQHKELQRQPACNDDTSVMFRQHSATLADNNFAHLLYSVVRKTILVI